MCCRRGSAISWERHRSTPTLCTKGLLGCETPLESPNGTHESPAAGGPLVLFGAGFLDCLQGSLPSGSAAGQAAWLSLPRDRSAAFTPELASHRSLIPGWKAKQVCGRAKQACKAEQKENVLLLFWMPEVMAECMFGVF